MLLRVLAAATFLGATMHVHAQAAGGGSLDALTRPRDSRVAHYSSLDPEGKNEDCRRIAPGETLTILDHSGPGIVRRFWLTIAPRNHTAIQRQFILRAWWDDEPHPSVEVPVSDFFGLGFGEWRDYVSLPLNMTSGGYNSYWAMPFRRHARITLENRSPVEVERLYYNLEVEVPAQPADDLLYFHAQFRRSTNYANVRLSVNGRPLSPLIEGYSPKVEPTGPVSFGRVALREGMNEIGLEIVGKDPRSQGWSDGYLVGIDGFMLRE